MKYIFIFMVGIGFFSFMSCEKVETSVPKEAPADSIIVSNGYEYFIEGKVGGVPFSMHNNVDSVGNSVLKEELNACGFGAETKFYSYFAYVSDTSRKQWVAFGLSNCVADTADGFTDSTYYVGNFPIEINDPDKASGFINYMDPDSNLWTSSGGPNGLGAQVSHNMNLTEVTKSYDATSALRVKGDFSGWVYNASGDSLLVEATGFFTRAWSY
ncbi:MAG: hypothetical protein ACPGRC_00730 [Salibacteraceae bacterium]